MVAVAAPTEERFAAVRALTRTETRFVVIAERTLDGLLSSRLFAARSVPKEQPAVVPQATDAAALTPRAAAAGAEIDPNLVEAIVAAVQRHRPNEVAPESPAPNASVSELVAQVDAAIAAWSGIRAVLATADDEVDALRRSLRETKEQLSVAHAENDQYHRRLRALEAEVADGRAVVAEARRRLQDAADALDGGTGELAASSDFG